MRVCALLVALLLVVCTLGCGATAAKWLMKCSNDLKSISLAMHNYHDAYGSFPPGYATNEDGRPMHSWRVYLLPFLEERQLFDRYNFDEPWDSEGNLSVAQNMPEVFRCPSAPRAEANLTHYVVILRDADEDGQARSMFGGNSISTFRDVRDGTSNTIMVAETKNSVPWTRPDTDLHFDTMDFKINAGQNSIGSYHHGGALVAMFDGAIHFLNEATPPDVVRKLVTPAGGEQISWDDLQ